LIPADAGRKTALARLVAALSAQDPDEGLLWISGYGTWPSSENLSLYYRIRQTLGDTRALAEAPCHLFRGTDREPLECVLDPILYFSWDAVLYPPTAAGAVLQVTNDEILSVWCPTQAACAAHLEAFSDFGLTAARG
jgi:hypothetical protein